MTNLDSAVLEHGACAGCSTEGWAVWHPGRPCPDLVDEAKPARPSTYDEDA